MHHVVKFNTFYVFDGEGDDIREYWEKMTAVRLEFFKEPGPVGTAIRIPGFAYPDLLIEVDAIAYAPELADR
jgi:enamine deaminase RidA (YjgF/YER057c/UK114 family)